MWDIIGHAAAVHTLEAEIAAGRLPHALLFTGPRGIGKTKLALELSKTLNCIGDEPPCGVCLHCRQIESGSHPDVSIVEPLDGKDSIVIGQVRAFRDAAALRAFQGKHKVYIFAGAERLTLQAADALLKILEEPQPQVTIVLTAAEARTLPSTVLSRCRILPLRPVEAEVLAAALETGGVATSEARRLALLARGSVGWALQAAKQPKLAAQREEMVQRAVSVFAMDLEARLQLAETLGAEGKDRGAIRRELEVMLLVARDVLFVREGLGARATPDADGDALSVAARKVTASEIQTHLRALRLAMVRIDANVDPRLAVEAALTAIP